MAYDEFHPDRSENRLVKTTLIKLQRLTSSSENSKEIRQLLTAFEMVETSKNYEKDFVHVVINRNTKDYEMRGHGEIKFKSGDGTTVRLHFVDVAHIEESLQELLEKVNKEVDKQWV